MTDPGDRRIQEAQRLLVCLRWGIGDLVMELPTLQALRRAVPGAHITALGAPPALELLEGETCVDELVSAVRMGFRHWGDTGTAAARQQVRAWSRRFDCVLDVTHAARGIQMSLSESAGGFDTGHWLRRASEAGTGLQLLARAVAASWGIDVRDVRPRLTLSAAEVAAARRMTCERLGSADPVLGVAPMASSRMKRGAAGEFARAADQLVADPGCSVLEFAGPDADYRVRDRMTRRGRALVAESRHLRSTAALLAQCSVLLCNDSGLMHLAAAVDVPVISVFACTSPRLYLPPGGTAVSRWEQPCVLPEAPLGGFGVTPCVEAGRCLRPATHERVERWADAAAAAARPWLVAAPLPG